MILWHRLTNEERIAHLKRVRQQIESQHGDTQYRRTQFALIDLHIEVLQGHVKDKSK